jgi:four helix bundle protein
MGDFRKLKAWQKSQELVESVYRITSGFPASERYGLSSQIRRAAVSISANLAEGCGRMGDTELRRFVRISLGSLSELESEILLAARLEMIGQEVSHQLLFSIGSLRGMLHKLHQILQSKGTG